MDNGNPAKFTCSACGRKYTWKLELAGQRAKCKCGNILKVPLGPHQMNAPTPSTIPSSSQGSIPAKVTEKQEETARLSVSKWLEGIFSLCLAGVMFFFLIHLFFMNPDRMTGDWMREDKAGNAVLKIKLTLNENHTFAYYRSEPGKSEWGSPVQTGTWEIFKDCRPTSSANAEPKSQSDHPQSADDANMVNWVRFESQAGQEKLPDAYFSGLTLNVPKSEELSFDREDSESFNRDIIVISSIVIWSSLYWARKNKLPPFFTQSPRLWKAMAKEILHRR
jgi:hypothetical protein